MQISVITLGNWGTALANHLAENGHDVLGWSNDSSLVNGINSTNHNPLYFSDVKLNPKLKATSDIKQCLKYETILFAGPSESLTDLVPHFKDSEAKLIISATKGFDKHEFSTPLNYFKKFVPSTTELAVISGPSFAIDLINSRPIGIVAGADNEDTAWKVSEIFSSQIFRVYISTDTIGVELGGILKNIIALAVAVCDGLNFGESAKASLITRGLAEMRRLAIKMGAQSETLFGLSGLGDLVMTSSSELSRNRRVGLRLAKGEKLEDITKSLGSVVEGVVSAPYVYNLSQKYAVDMPICALVNKFIQGQTTIHDAAKELLSRPSKKEF